jgi:hypothetical protein
MSFTIGRSVVALNWRAVRGAPAQAREEQLVAVEGELAGADGVGGGQQDAAIDRGVLAVDLRGGLLGGGRSRQQ